jgi:hypothetical protein
MNGLVLYPKKLPINHQEFFRFRRHFRNSLLYGLVKRMTTAQFFKALSFYRPVGRVPAPATGGQSNTGG